MSPTLEAVPWDDQEFGIKFGNVYLNTTGSLITCHFLQCDARIENNVVNSPCELLKMIESTKEAQTPRTYKAGLFKKKIKTYTLEPWTYREFEDYGDGCF